IPVYLYEQAATRPDRVDLANIRKGEFEGLREEIEKNPERAPDFGKPKLHPTAGATVVGARFPLIAYNINLNTNDLNVAKNIAKAIRFKDGGLRYVKALGFEIKEKNCVQVSINMTNYLQTPLYRVFEMVKREAERYGVMIKESEIVGLVPLKALIDTAIYYLQLDTFKENQILELRLPETKSLAGFLSEVASPSPTPGGGAVSALTANLGTSLLIMVCNLTIGKKSYIEYEDKMKELRSKLDVYAQRFYNLIQLDCDAFNRVMDAFKSKEENKMEQALKEAINVPFEVMEKSLEVLKLSPFIAEYGNKNAISDCGVGINLLYSAMKGAYYNVLINLVSLKDEEFKKEKKEKSISLLKEGEKLLKELEEKVFLRIS
ncbi:MAG: glutamate formimidoyltransferase, partial [candidate division WOR-3 bacterium]